MHTNLPFHNCAVSFIYALQNLPGDVVYWLVARHANVMLAKIIILNKSHTIN